MSDTSVETPKPEARVYEYGALLPSQGEALLDEQIRLGHEYHTQIVAVERARMVAHDLAVCSMPETQRLRAEADALEEQIRLRRTELKTERSSTRTTNLVLAGQISQLEDTLKATLVALGKAKRPFWGAVKQASQFFSSRSKMWKQQAREAKAEGVPAREIAAMKLTFKAETQTAVVDFMRENQPAEVFTAWQLRHRADLEADAKRNALYNESPLLWGSKLHFDGAVEDAVKAVTGQRKAKRARRLTARPQLPRFPEFNGSGVVVIQLQNGLTVSELFGGEDTRLRLSTPDYSKKKKPTIDLSFRIGSDESRRPVWAQLPIVLHRRLPKDGVLKWARLQRWSDGPAFTLTRNGRTVKNWRWNIQFILEAPSFQEEYYAPNEVVPPSVPKLRLARKKSIAIDLGWRRHDAGAALPYIRLGYWKDSEGQSAELRVPAGVPERLDYANSLRATKDSNFNAMKTRLKAWLASMETVPEWLREECKSLSHWREAGRLVRLHSRWTAERFEGDAAPVLWIPPWREAAYTSKSQLVQGVPVKSLRVEMSIVEWLTEWRRQDEHLWTWEARQARKARLHRREQYRILAKRLALEYQTITIEALDLTDFASYPKPEEGPVREDESSRRLRTQASPSEFRSALVHAAHKYGAECVEVDPKNTTQMCAACGHLNQWNTKPKIKHTCAGCGVEWDQDKNAALNIERRGAL